MSDDLYRRDTLVLAHLRGYPEELRHYSNLIKQAHPRGMSALDFVLRRPAASDSLIAAVCRAVAAGESVLSAVEAAERFGVTPRAFLETIASQPDFPAPLFANAEKRIWRSEDIEARAGATGPPGGQASRGHRGQDPSLGDV
ncbi:MAG TPA: hypothetical protein VGR25_04125 [bacterium]|jgi:hypothetical protein|nr:hypothetical protein [bacterium]